MATLAPGGTLLERLQRTRAVRGLGVMWNVTFALIMRESRTRHGTSDLGYAWALLEPLIQLLVLWAVYSMLSRHVPIAASMPVFLVTGIIPFHFWADCVRRGAAAIHSNLPLLTYPQVRPFDVILSRTILEAATTATVILIFIVGLKILYGEPLSSWVDEPLLEVEAVMALFYFGLSCSYFSAGISRLFPPWDSLFGYLSRPLWFTSGIFFTLQSLPNGVKGYATINPVAHMLEWLRSATLPGFESESYSRVYVLSFATVVLLIGLGVDRLLTIIGHTDQSH